MTWSKLPELWPTNGSTVWVRRLYSNYPFKAVYNSTTDEFTTLDGHVIPWWFIDRWKAV